MKRFLSLAVTAVLIFTLAAGTLGAVQSSYGSSNIWFSGLNESYPWEVGKMTNSRGLTFPVLMTDTWFSIEKDPTKVLYSSVRFLDGDSTLGIGYFINDQTFAEFFSNPSDNVIKGSYLFTNGIFVGLSYDTETLGSSTIISPGYRFNFSNDSYLALSADFYWEDGGDSNQNIYEAVVKYYGEKYKLMGQAIINTESDHDFYALLYNYLVCDNITLGFRLNNDAGADEAVYAAGGTYICNQTVLDVIVGNYIQEKQRQEDDDLYIVVSGMFGANDNLTLGAEFFKLFNNDGYYYGALKAKYNFDFGALAGYYRLASHEFESQLLIGFEKQF